MLHHNLIVMQFLPSQLSMKKSSKKLGPHIGNFVYVSTEDELLVALADLEGHTEVAFDSEGVDLGREGPLTIATFRGLDVADAPIYVVDVKVLGGDVVFSDTSPSFRALLEDISITKITFDCRTDSDALFHQFRVSLRGVLDLQVLDQAVRIQKGEAPPDVNRFLLSGGIRYVQGMADVLPRYSTPGSSLVKLSPPHNKYDSSVWGKRPLSEAALAYAACDAKVIGTLLVKMRETTLSEMLTTRVQQHSQRYVKYFRDADKSKLRDKNFIMEEHALVRSEELPSAHPRIPREDNNKARSKWDQAVMQLCSKDRELCQKAHSNAMFVLQHNEWYTEEGLERMRKLSTEYPFFTAKQRASLLSPRPLKGDEYDDEYYDSDDGFY